MKAAVRSGQAVRGIFGATPIARIPSLDLVWGTVPEYMHCVLEGVIKQLTEAWMTSTYSAYYIGTSLASIDDRLVRITPPPIMFSRNPRGLKERALWKAKEWRYWLLYYALPCLVGILPRQYYAHLSLLCQAIFLLLQKRVSHSDIRVAEDVLKRFLCQVAPLYGESAETSNMHLLMHLPKCVTHLGPLWATSMFPFESANGTVLHFITAYKGAAKQVAERWIMRQSLLFSSTKISLPHHLDVIFRMFLRGTSSRTNGTLGNAQDVRFTAAQQNVLSAYFSHVPAFQMYHRARILGLDVQCAAYQRCKRTCTRFIKTKDGAFCEVLYILKTVADGNIFLLSKKLITDGCLGSTTYVHKCIIPPQDENLRVLPSCDMESVCVCVKVTRDVYLCDMPNFYEKE
ncbi:uncharacterized protein LOC135379165 [Ornithodoros turicata]|uniref:uncharacterized protein LOC135379165 n=1 Tax=Ornithodoros turicata TaxID=34597 RepID=UPI003138BA0E